MTNLPTELLWGEDAIEEEIGGLRFRSARTRSCRRTRAMAEQLYALAREFAAADAAARPSTTSTAGSARSASRSRRDALTVWGIEISEESVACAIENQELNGIGNAAFFAGNVGEVLRDLRDRAGDPDVVVVDPPRAGLAGKALKRLGETGAPRIVYVSCNPTTLAGDVKRLADDYGYGWCARDPSTCSRTRRTSSASRCSNARLHDELSLPGVRDAVPALRRAAGVVPDLRGRASVRPARHRAGVGDVAVLPRQP